MTCKLGLTEDVIVLLLYKLFLKYDLYKGFYSSIVVNGTFFGRRIVGY